MASDGSGSLGDGRSPREGARTAAGGTAVRDSTVQAAAPTVPVTLGAVQIGWR